MKETEFYRDKSGILVKVGFVTILGVIILFVGYGWLRDWFNQSRYSRLDVKFVNAGNIEPGNPVTLFGVKRGRVDGITMTETGVILHLLVDMEFNLPADTKFYISDSDLMGNRQVDIIPGSSEKFIEPGMIAEGENLAGLSALIPRIDGIINNLDQMITKIANQDDLFDDLRETVVSSRKLMNTLDGFFAENYDELESIVTNLNQTIREINALFTDEEINLQEAMHSIVHGMSELDTLLQKMNNLLDDVEPFLAKLNEEEGTLHHLLSDKELYERLLQTTGQIDSLLYDIRQNPRKYFQLRVF